MQNRNCGTVALIMILALLTNGCDRPKGVKSNGASQSRKPNAPGPSVPSDPTVEGEVVGLWEGKVGDAAKGDTFTATMTLDVRSDNTFTLTNAMPDKTDPAKGITNKAEGHWAIEGECLVLTLERSLTGGEIPPEQKQVKFWPASDTNGKLVSILRLGQFRGTPFRKRHP